MHVYARIHTHTLSQANSTQAFSAVPHLVDTHPFFCFFLAALSLPRYTGAFSSCSKWGFAALCGLLIVVASLVAENRFQSTQASAAATRRH